MVLKIFSSIFVIMVMTGGSGIKVFHFPLDFLPFFDYPFGMSFGFAYGEGVNMYHYQNILFNTIERICNLLVL